MKEIVIVSGVRTAQGTFGGALKDFTHQQLAAFVIQALLQRVNIDPQEIDEVILGCVGQQSDAPNVARVAALMAGLPTKMPAMTVARNCASGIQAITSACQAIACGDAEIVIAGGTECMSSLPYVSRDLRFGKRLQNSAMVDSLWEGLTDPVCHQIMGETAENLASEFNISREAQDQFAAQSHQRAFKATREGRFKDEIAPLSIPKKARGKAMPPEIFTEDEGINVALTEQMLALYPAVFKEGGSVTAGNACPISDGAACVLMMTRERAQQKGYAPLGTIRAYGYAGVEPERMGLGPSCATPIALKKAKMALKDIQLIEINEAFAAQVLACERTMQFNRDITNVNGGAIALGHPVGTTGIRITITLLNEMKRRNLTTGLATLCVGGGMGGALIMERK